MEKEEDIISCAIYPGSTRFLEERLAKKLNVDVS